MASAHLVQRLQTFLPDLWREIKAQCLSGHRILRTKRCQSLDPSGTKERQRTSSAMSIKVWALDPWRQPTISVALSLKKIDSMSEKSSPGEMAPLIRCCKARSLESEGGYPAGAGKLHPRDRLPYASY